MSLSRKTPAGLFVLLVFLAGPVALFWDPGFSRQLFQVNRDSLLEASESGTGKPAQFSPGLTLLLKGDATRKSDDERWRALHETHPTSPLHFARYLQMTHSLPDDFRETVEQVAPDNGWFDLWEVAQRSPGVFEEEWEPAMEEANEEEEIPHYRILDEAGMERLISLFHQAAAKPEFTDYFHEMQALLLAELSAPVTYLDQLTYLLAITEAYSPSIPRDFFVEDPVGPACQFLISQDDRAGFRRFEESYRWVASRLLENAHSLIDAVLFEGWLFRTTSQVAHTARHFKMEALAQKYHDLHEALVQYFEERRARKTENWDRQTTLFENHGTFLVNLTTGFKTVKPRELTKDDFRPSCRAEKALFSRLYTGSAFLLFTALGLDCWVKKLRIRNELIDEVCERSQSLPSSTPWKILFWGVMLPFSLFLLIRYLTPLGQLDFALLSPALQSPHSLKSHPFIHLAVPFLAWVLVIGAAVALTLRRLTTPEDRFRASEILLIALPLAAALIHGMFQLTDQSPLILPVAGALLMASLIWLGFLFIRAHLRKAALAELKNRLAMPAFFFAAGLFGIWTWALTIEERSWIARDDFGKPVGHHLSHYEAEMVQRQLAELEEFLP